MNEPKKETVRITLPPRLDGKPGAANPREAAMVNLPPKPLPTATGAPPTMPSPPKPGAPPTPGGIMPPAPPKPFAMPSLPKPGMTATPPAPAMPRPPGAPAAPTAAPLPPKPLSAAPKPAVAPPAALRPVSSAEASKSTSKVNLAPPSRPPRPTLSAFPHSRHYHRVENDETIRKPSRSLVLAAPFRSYEPGAEGSRRRRRKRAKRPNGATPI